MDVVRLIETAEGQDKKTITCGAICASRFGVS
jgi:hypothetical protein